MECVAGWYHWAGCSLAFRLIHSKIYIFSSYSSYLHYVEQGCLQSEASTLLGLLLMQHWGSQKQIHRSVGRNFAHKDAFLFSGHLLWLLFDTTNLILHSEKMQQHTSFLFFSVSKLVASGFCAHTSPYSHRHNASWSRDVRLKLHHQWSFFGHQNQHANNKPNKNGVLHCWTPTNRFNQTKLWHLLPFPIILQLLGPLRPGWLPTANQRFWVRIWGFASDPCSWCMDIYLILCGRFSMVVTWSKQVSLRKAECYRSTTNGCKTRAYTWIKNKIEQLCHGMFYSLALLSI